jgi:hypothetical protein
MKTEIAETEKKPLLGNGTVYMFLRYRITGNNRGIFGSPVFYWVHAGDI